MLIKFAHSRLTCGLYLILKRMNIMLVLGNYRGNQQHQNFFMIWENPYVKGRTFLMVFWVVHWRMLRQRASGWIIQICDLQGQISSLHLIQKGLYVAIPQYKFGFPTSISGLESLMNTFIALKTFVTQMGGHANNIRVAIDELENRRRSRGKQFGRPKSPLLGNSKTEWERPTWYSPVRGDQSKSRIPLYLFGNIKDVDDFASPGKPENDRSKGEAPVAAETDEYGFIMTAKTG
ncbi:hypothetical protein BDA99DRAFT_509675 [Phascolomyces articulosus]|uniref:Uncharacterized protein n=1 Tax=Phascolomyces articulosus TaxID=60185 RepID=A0AAD5K088_9FUNG|nr:hypothetical protein BDA99DRAFT_509675 [Phascolomyces articulosus]